MSSENLMQQRSFPFLLPFLIFLSLVSASESGEIQQLLKLKSALQRSNTNVFTSWTEENSVCDFIGIVCDHNGFVREINLSQQQLEGNFSFESICMLQSLERISVGLNLLHGRIDEGIKNCSRLQHLDLNGNLFTGEVPDLSFLRGLKFLNLSMNGFSGPFPWKSLENLTDLAVLSVGDNPFSESPFPVEVLKLEKLYCLYLTNCSLTGKIPEGIGNLTMLENLELSYNQLSGEIPSGIGNLKKLQQLEIYENALTGKFPLGLRNLTSLLYFDASTNNLEGDLSELKYLKQLVSLSLFENQFSGEIPEEFGDFKNLTVISLYRNNFTGRIPEKLGSWTDFKMIDASENYLTGSIPPDMCKNGKLTDLLLLQNKLTGGIPDAYINCSSLVRLRINNNSLSGTVPAGIWSLPNLTMIDLTMNRFEGLVASDIGKAKSLCQLFIANNQLSGKLPESISEATSLVSIQASSNRFTGEIPASIGKLKKLDRIYLNDNMFSGMLPDSLGFCVSLKDINIAKNSLKGNIPGSLGSLPALNSLNLSYNKLYGEIPTSLSSLRLSLLDLSNNQLSGEVPESLSIQALNGDLVGNTGLCSDTIDQLHPCSSRIDRRHGHIRTFILCFVVVALTLLLLLGCFLFLKPRQNNIAHTIKPNSWKLKPYHVLSFPENEIVNAIKKEYLIGTGGSGNVYKVKMNDGTELAVKHIWTPDSCENSKTSTPMRQKSNSTLSEYESEVATLSSVRHVNLVKLYCSITSEDSKLLVYEFLPNGSLWDGLHTYKNVEMTWEVKYEIALGAAKGLEYLHHGFTRPVIHRDVKSSNILLDKNWKPKIADFGLARILQADGGGDWTNVVVGTHGYMPPEYAYTHKVNEKSDVYSFGVVLMELVTGRRPIEPEFGENKDIVHWVCSMMESKDTILRTVDPSIPKALREYALKVVRIAIHCTARLPALRPSMRMVVQRLEEAEPCKLINILVEKKSDYSQGE